MALTPAQKTALKADILANANVIASGQFAGTAVKDVPNSNDGNIAVAAWYSLAASPTYLVWDQAASKSAFRAAVTLANYTPSDAVPTGPSTDLTYSNRAFLCQLKQANLMFLLSQDGAMDAGGSTLRQAFQDCMRAIPSGASGANQDAGWGTAGSPNAARLTLMRSAKNIEKLFAVAGSGAGNQAGDARGATTNPDVLVYVGGVSSGDVENARNS